MPLRLMSRTVRAVGSDPDVAAIERIAVGLGHWSSSLFLCVRHFQLSKVATAEHLWIPAVNNWRGAGRWAFLEVTDSWDSQSLIREKFFGSGVLA